MNARETFQPNTIITQLGHNKELQRLIRFLVVGLSGTILDFSLLIVLKEAFGLPTLLANTLAFSAGVVNNFTLNRLWTFSDSRSKSALIQMGQFATVSTVGVLLNNVIVLALETPLAILPLVPGYVAAKVVATLIVVFWNFLVNRYWTFGDVS